MVYNCRVRGFNSACEAASYTFHACSMQQTSINLGANERNKAFEFELRAKKRLCKSKNDAEASRGILCRCRYRVRVKNSRNDISEKFGEIILMRKRGHIFIQTDRPVYKPGEKCKGCCCSYCSFSCCSCCSYCSCCGCYGCCGCCGCCSWLVC